MENYYQKAKNYLYSLYEVKPNRRTGSKGNGAATDFFKRSAKYWGYDIDAEKFDCLDFYIDEVFLQSDENSFKVHASPYSLNCDSKAELVAVHSVEELKHCNCSGKILLMKGEICREQLMPRKFIFYNPEHHRCIYSLLEEKNQQPL